MMKALSRLIGALASLRLTVFCLAAAMVLVFAGTIAQRTLDIYIVQTQYFQSWFVWWQGSPGGFRFPMFPGGHLIGGVLLLNLIAAFIVQFPMSFRKVGFCFTHLGLIIMLGGGLATDLFSVTSFMRLMEGQTKNYSESDQLMELAVIDPSDSEMDTVTAIPSSRLAQGGEISHPSLPFRLAIRGFYQNSELSMIGQSSGAVVPASSQGTGARVSVTARPPATGVNERNVMSAVLEVTPLTGGASLGTWLVSDALAVAQEVTWEGKTWNLQLRAQRYYKPYSLTLVEFTHTVYPGSQIPKDYSSHVTLDDPVTGDHRPVRIYMNHPLRYQGDTYYQSSFMQQGNGTVLQVVRNPSYTAPYISCAIVTFGLLWQFIFHLMQFNTRRATQVPSRGNAASPSPIES